jgi:glycosyltransferase involved in cell wall biosynthesis
MPLATIIVPTYNCAPWILRALRSAWSQTFSDFEVIIVDDGSTDNTGEVLARVEPHSKVRVIRQQNGGAPSARNTGIRASDSKYIALLDADDELDSAALELTIAASEATGAALCATDFVRIYSGNMEVRQIPEPTGNLLHAILRDYFCDRALLFRRSSLEEIGGYNPEIRKVEDWELGIRIFERNMPFVRVAQPLYRYYWREGSVVTGCPDLVLYMRKIFRMHHKRLADAGDREAAKIFAEKMWGLASWQAHEGGNYLRALAYLWESLVYDPNPARVLRSLRRRVPKGLR